MTSIGDRQAARRLLRSSLHGRARDVLRWACWSAVEAVPAFLTGRLVAWAVDRGFLRGHTVTGLEYLGLLAVSVLVGTWGTRQSYQRLASIIEPFRDQLVSLAVRGALRRSAIPSAEAETAAVARLTQQVEIVREVYASLLMYTQEFLITSVGALVGLLTLIPGAFVLVLGPLLLGLIVFLSALGRMAIVQRSSILADERLSESASSVCGGLRDVAACGGESVAGRTIDERIAEQADATIHLARFQAFRSLALALGGWLPIVLILVRAPWLAHHGASTGAILGALVYVMQGVLPALQTFVGTIGDGGLWLLVTLQRIVQATEIPGSAARRPGAVPASDAGVRLADVTFSFGREADPVIERLGLVVPPGDHLAIVGPSGVGKSTLANLISGILEPDEGEVRYSRQLVSELDPEALARYRVLIPQEAYLFSGTARENLLYLNESGTDLDLDLAVEQLGARALLDRLGGYEARVKASELSAGERQLLTLVRASLASAPLVILDEATCHLDPAAEARVEEAFARRDGTLIVVAHRISSALRARHILVLDGHEALLGTHAELLERSELYRDLVGHWQANGDGELPPHPARRRPAPPPLCT
jgi:ATP-binding cassette subfamily C protein